MRKILFLLIIFAVPALLWSNGYFETRFDSGLKLLDAFEFDMAEETFRHVAINETASVDLRIKAYFCLAYLYKAQNLYSSSIEEINKMISLKKERDYATFSKGLPTNVSSDPEMKRLFENVVSPIPESEIVKRLSMIEKKLSSHENEIKYLRTKTVMDTSIYYEEVNKLRSELEGKKRELEEIREKLRELPDTRATGSAVSGDTSINEKVRDLEKYFDEKLGQTGAISNEIDAKMAKLNEKLSAYDEEARKFSKQASSDISKTQTDLKTYGMQMTIVTAILAGSIILLIFAKML